MTGAGCGIADVNLPQHSIKWREKSGLVRFESDRAMEIREAHRTVAKTEPTFDRQRRDCARQNAENIRAGAQGNNDPHDFPYRCGCSRACLRKSSKSQGTT